MRGAITRQIQERQVWQECVLGDTGALPLGHRATLCGAAVGRANERARRGG